MAGRAPEDGSPGRKKRGHLQTQVGRVPGSGSYAVARRGKRIKSVGRQADRYYCPRCGLRHKLCTCTTTTQEEP